MALSPSMFPPDFRVAVTGGAGYVGSHVVASLNAGGLPPSRILCIDNLSRGYGQLPPDMAYSANLDVRNHAALAGLFGSWGPQIVIHLAGLRDARESISSPGDYYSVNVEGTNCVAAAARAAGSVRAIVLSSSCSIYGESASPVGESSGIAPLSPYARSKVAAEDVLRDHWSSGGARPVILRYFNAAGFSPPGRPDTRSAGVLSALLSCYRSGDAFRLFGLDHQTDDGSCVRDYVHISDIADAHLQICTKIAGGLDLGYLEYNVGPGVTASVLDVVKAFESVTSHTVALEVVEPSAADPGIVTGDYSRFAGEFTLARRRTLANIVESVCPALHQPD